MERLATPCECVVMSSDTGPSQVLRKTSTKGMKLNFRYYKATIALQNPVSTSVLLGFFFPLGIIIICGQGIEQATQPGLVIKE